MHILQVNWGILLPPAKEQKASSDGDDYNDFDDDSDDFVDSWGIVSCNLFISYCQ